MEEGRGEGELVGVDRDVRVESVGAAQSACALISLEWRRACARLQCEAGAVRLAHADAHLGVEDLAVQVGQLDRVVVEDRDVACCGGEVSTVCKSKKEGGERGRTDSCGGEVEQDGATESSRTDHENARALKLELTCCRRLSAIARIGRAGREREGGGRTR